MAEVRIHGTTGETPWVRFEREERFSLAHWRAGRPRELVRVVSSEACVEVDANRYSVPWRLIGETVRVRIEGTLIVVSHGAKEVARHERLCGSRGRAVDPRHFDGLVGRAFRPRVAELSAAALKP